MNKDILHMTEAEAIGELEDVKRSQINLQNALKTCDAGLKDLLENSLINATERRIALERHIKTFESQREM